MHTRTAKRRDRTWKINALGAQRMPEKVHDHRPHGNAVMQKIDVTEVHAERDRGQGSSELAVWRRVKRRASSAQEPSELEY